MDLIEQLETLRIPDSDFFGQSTERQREYKCANSMLDECLQIVWNWIRENHLELYLII